MYLGNCLFFSHSTSPGVQKHRVILFLVNVRVYLGWLWFTLNCKVNHNVPNQKPNPSYSVIRILHGTLVVSKPRALSCSFCVRN